MLRKWLSVLLPLLALLCVSGSVRAQDEEHEIIYVRYLLSTDMIQDTDAATDSQNLIDQLRTNLANDGITLIVLGWNTRPNSNLAIRIGGDGAGNAWVNIKTSTPYHLTASSALSVHYGNDANFPLQDSLISTSMATALSLYSLNHCALAADYFETASARISTVEESYRPYLSASIAFYQGTCAIAEGNYALAVSIFENGLPPSENNWGTYPDIIANLAWAYLQLDDQQRAFELMDSLVNSRNNDQIFALSQRAQLYALAFRYDDALADMDAALEIASQQPESDWNDLQLAQLYVLRGNITLLIYEWDSVLADYNAAIELNPDYADAYFYRAIFFYTRAEYPAAMDDFTHYLELAPDGEHAADAATYIDEIERTQAALDG